MKTIEEAMKRTSEAAEAFEGRWTMRALKRIDAEIGQALQDQIDLFNQALVTGAMSQVKLQGEALIRGYVACAKIMSESGEPDDAYMIGQDMATGTKVAVGFNRSCINRVRELHGERVVWVTPDEVASMFAGMQTVAKVKQLWPGAEIERIDRYEDEPAKGDA